LTADAELAVKLLAAPSNSKSEFAPAAGLGDSTASKIARPGWNPKPRVLKTGQRQTQSGG
jgi:hypothetical protein